MCVAWKLQLTRETGEAAGDTHVEAPFVSTTRLVVDAERKEKVQVCTLVYIFGWRDKKRERKWRENWRAIQSTRHKANPRTKIALVLSLFTCGRKTRTKPQLLFLEQLAADIGT